jgi:glycosyltransferase involved in cell wall biosynthesis
VRVCVVTVASHAHGFGGMQTHTSDLCRGLVASGHEVEAIAPLHPHGTTWEDRDGAVWHFLDVASRKPGRPMRSRDWLRRSAEAFERLHAAKGFDVVHSESTSALGLLRRKARHRVPVAVEFHGNFLGLAGAAARRARTAPGLHGRVEEAKYVTWVGAHHFVPLDTVYAFRSCEAMVPSHQQVRGTRWSYLLDPERLHVVPNGVDTEAFMPRPQEEARAATGAPDGPLLLCVGRLDREKGFHHALEALVRLDGTRLVVVGTGTELEPLQALARDLGVAERVKFAGAQPQEAIPGYLAAADVFLFPTEREEAAPLVVPQAMSCGVPTIASSIGGITEVIDRPGENGVLVPPGDVDALIAAASRLLDDAELRERMGRAARSRVEAEYTVEKMVDRTLAVYEFARARPNRGR